MEVQNTATEESSRDEANWKNIEKSHRRGKVMGGLLVVTIGSLYLARELGAEIPYWVFTWKMLLIGIGITLAAKHKFRHPGWIILIAIGGAFLLTDLYPELQIKPILWPSLIILLGIIMIFKPRRKKFRHLKRQGDRFQREDYAQHYRHSCVREEPSNEDFIESTAVMAGVKKNILSKNFKGGEITNVFGGTELNLSQADFEGKASLEITQVFGGTKLIVPANWEIRSEQTVTVFGSVEDKRAAHPSANGETIKVLVITGTTVFGGIDIRSY